MESAQLPPYSPSVLSLPFRDRVNRAYGVWWDIVNTGTVIFLLFVLFAYCSIMLITGQTDRLPFATTFWSQFLTTVPLDRQSEIGLSLFGVSVSAATAGALYLVSVGTQRWSAIRRAGQVFQFFAEEVACSLSFKESGQHRLGDVMRSFDAASSTLMDQVSGVHPRAQHLFEHARLRANLCLLRSGASLEESRQVALDLFSAALLCRKTIRMTFVDQSDHAEILHGVRHGPRTYVSLSTAEGPQSAAE